MKYLLDIEKLITENPNVIFQVSGADLKAFAEQLLIGAKAIAMQETEALTTGDQLLTIDEASELLSVSKMTLYRWDQTGILKKVEIGGKRRYRKSDIERLVGCKLL
ncbi:MAG: helix-turn-helix domain-containing protein [Bacteroidales bacterium]|nr:helix-turn-helix domain-containing protein [Bacteroidales bacterium]